MNLTVGDRQIGPGQPCFIIAEVGLAHDGSLSAAHAYIDAVARAGVDAVKFQCHLGDPVSEWRVPPDWSRDIDRQEYWKRTGFPDEEWARLEFHCIQAGVEFLCSPFSVEAVKLIDPYVRLWKVPSGKVTDMALLKAIGQTNKPVLLSTGMGTETECSNAYLNLVNWGSQVLLLHCISMYPCPPQSLGLDVLTDLNANYESFYAGLSDHSGTIYPGIAAAALGCQVLEVHVCFSKEQGGFDTAASLDMGQLRQLVEGVRFVEKAMQPVDKDALAERLAETRRVFMGATA